MTVAELIAILQELPQNMDVHCLKEDSDFFWNEPCDEKTLTVVNEFDEDFLVIGALYTDEDRKDAPIRDWLAQKGSIDEQS